MSGLHGGRGSSLHDLRHVLAGVARTPARFRLGHSAGHGNGNSPVQFLSSPVEDVLGALESPRRAVECPHLLLVYRHATQCGTTQIADQLREQRSHPRVALLV